MWGIVSGVQVKVVVSSRLIEFIDDVIVGLLACVDEVHKILEQVGVVLVVVVNDRVEFDVIRLFCLRPFVVYMFDDLLEELVGLPGDDALIHERAQSSL